MYSVFIVFSFLHIFCRIFFVDAGELLDCFYCASQIVDHRTQQYCSSSLLHELHVRVLFEFFLGGDQPEVLEFSIR